MDNQTNTTTNDQSTDVVVLKFADSKIPEFKEVRSKEYILYGESNDYPEYLNYLYNKSAKHNAIINGKSRYILGSGVEKKTPLKNGFAPFVNPDGSITPGRIINAEGESMTDVMQKGIKDVEIYGGLRLVLVMDKTGKVAEIYHRDFYKFRTSKETGGGFYYKEDWTDRREDPKPYPEYDPSKKQKGSVVFAYNEYRPGCKYYPLPGYVGCCNYLETDIEISKFHLSTLRNGMMPSKMVQFFNGEPPDEKKKEIERRWQRKFTGSESAGRFILVFNKNRDSECRVDDLSFNELDKQFEIVNKTCQQEIFTGHEVTSPTLFGIKTEGQLGGVTELKTAYEIFINTYAKPKQDNLARIVNYFGKVFGVGEDYYFGQVDPVGLILDIKDVLNILPIEFVFEKLGVPKKYWPATAPAQPAAPASPAPGQELESDKSQVNENLKNLTGKQNQHLLRVIRQYSKGQITKDQAVIILKASFGFSDDEINSLLGINDTGIDEEFSGEAYDDDAVVQMFEGVGDEKSDYHVVRTKRIFYASDNEAVVDELKFYQQAFKNEVTVTEAAILDLIKKDKRVTPEVIAETLGTTPEYVTSKIASLVKRGLLTTSTQVIGDDVQIERTLTEPLKDIVPPNEPIETTEILIKYSYEGPKDARNRPFCKKMLELNRLYSRQEIELISQKLGYSVFDRCGGWWTKPDGTRSPKCRHRWVSNVVVKKKGGVK